MKKLPNERQRKIFLISSPFKPVETSALVKYFFHFKRGEGRLIYNKIALMQHNIELANQHCDPYSYITSTLSGNEKIIRSHLF